MCSNKIKVTYINEADAVNYLCPMQVSSCLGNRCPDWKKEFEKVGIPETEKAPVDSYYSPTGNGTCGYLSEDGK